MTWPPFIPRTHPLPAEVAEARAEFERINAKNREILEPLIGAHLTAYDAARVELLDAHRYIADQTPLALDGQTRDAGRWLLTGRCLGLAHAAHVAVASGFTVEVIPILRSLHEAARLLSVFGLQGEDDLVERWLKGRSVSRGQVMAASRRQEDRYREDMLKHGVSPPGTTSDYFEQQYGRWSEFTHHRRRHLLNQVAVPDRVMAVGPHPDWRARAAAVDHLGRYIAELISVGGHAVADLGRPEWIDRFQATFHSLLDLQSRIPLRDIAEGKQPPPSGGVGQ